MQNGADGNNHSWIYQDIWKTNVTIQPLNNGMNPFKYVQIYIYMCIIPNIHKTPHGYIN